MRFPRTDRAAESSIKPLTSGTTIAFSRSSCWARVDTYDQGRVDKIGETPRVPGVYAPAPDVSGVQALSQHAAALPADFSATVVKHRIESALNSRLSEVIPHVYGAVFAYAMYVLARLVIEVATFYGTTGSTSSAAGLGLWDFLRRLTLFSCIVLFMVEDVGEIIKYQSLFPMRRSTRYSHELFIASFYLCAFALLEVGSVLTWGAFGCAVFFGGVWCNQLKEEYLGHPSKVHALARTQRDLQYIGGGLFLLETGVFILQHSPKDIATPTTICFLATFLVWIFAYVAIPAIKHGAECNGLLVSTIVPDRIILWLQRFFSPGEKVTLKGDDHGAD